MAAADAVLVVARPRRHARRRIVPSLWHIVLFFIGAFAMRGAGCTWNDLVDRDLDARSSARARGRSRPAR